MRLPSLSLAFPAYNEEVNVAKTIETAITIGEQIADDIEIIIVNDGSLELRQGLILRRGSHASINRQVTEESGYLGFPHFRRMALAVEEDVAFNPLDIGLLGAQAIMTNSKCIADLVQQAGSFHESLLAEKFSIPIRDK